MILLLLENNLVLSKSQILKKCSKNGPFHINSIDILIYNIIKHSINIVSIYKRLNINFLI